MCGGEPARGRSGLVCDRQRGRGCESSCRAPRDERFLRGVCLARVNRRVYRQGGGGRAWWRARCKRRDATAEQPVASSAWASSRQLTRGRRRRMPRARPAPRPGGRRASWRQTLGWEQPWEGRPWEGGLSGCLQAIRSPACRGGAQSPADRVWLCASRAAPRLGFCSGGHLPGGRAVRLVHQGEGHQGKDTRGRTHPRPNPHRHPARGGLLCSVLPSSDRSALSRASLPAAVRRRQEQACLRVPGSTEQGSPGQRNFTRWIGRAPGKRPDLGLLPPNHSPHKHSANLGRTRARLDKTVAPTGQATQLLIAWGEIHCDRAGRRGSARAPLVYLHALPVGMAAARGMLGCPVARRRMRLRGITK